MSPGALLPHGRVIVGEMRCGAIPIRLVHALEVGGAVLVQFAQCLSNNVHMAIGIDAAGNGNPNQIDFGIVNHALLILIRKCGCAQFRNTDTGLHVKVCRQTQSGEVSRINIRIKFPGVNIYTVPAHRADIGNAELIQTLTEILHLADTPFR